MIDREKLIELIGDIQNHGIRTEHTGNGVNIFHTSNGQIADYLLTNGVIVPPCKVGDKVYRITHLRSGETIIVEGEMLEIAITHEYGGKISYRFYFLAKGEEYIRRHWSLWCDFAEFGTGVFLSREEAEKALKSVTDTNVGSKGVE